MSRIRMSDLDQELIDQISKEITEDLERKHREKLEAALRREAARLRVGDWLVIITLFAFSVGCWFVIFRGVAWLLNL